MAKSLRSLLVAALFARGGSVRVDEDEEEDFNNGDGLEADRGMLRWARDGGIKGAEHLDFKRFPKGADNFMVRGVAATKDYKAGDVVVEVPAEMLLWSAGKKTLKHLADVGVPAQLLQESCGGLEDSDCWRLRLASALLQMRDAKEETHWGAYVKQLPSWHDFKMYHPMAAEELLLKTFDKLPISKSIRRTQAVAADRYSLYKEMGGTASPDDFKWANLVVHAYSWGMPNSNGALLVPIGDSFNTATREQQNVKESVGNPDEGGSFVFTATKDIPAGSEILDMYQDTDDDDFVKSWGFPLKGEKQETLSSEDCNELKSNIGNTVATPTGSCQAPENHPQPVAFCSMARLALEHCLEL
eukprot:TRINITY_DN9351_c0_g1_i1.p1 TRINITY_DN9351_c0_g1~~TRINITY_DN9351_c0_g1_i1.p1  ORF type:complete len:357 (-),score=121.02 TRINITY_DN9351_c0_g1_i1:431-1501(-)